MVQQCSVCSRIVEETIEGRQKKRKCVFFSSAARIYQEVRVSESGSAETALEKGDKKELNQIVCRLYTD